MVTLSSLLKRKGYSSKALLKQTRGFLYRDRFIFYVWHFHTAFWNLQNEYFRGFIFLSGELFKEHLFLKRSCSCFFPSFGFSFPSCSSFFLVSWLSSPELTKPASWLSLTVTLVLWQKLSTWLMYDIELHTLLGTGHCHTYCTCCCWTCDCYWCSNCLSVCISVL